MTSAQRLSTLRDRNGPHYDVATCIPGRCFKVRRSNMRRLLVATRGMVFTLSSIEHLVAHTRIRDFVTRG